MTLSLVGTLPVSGLQIGIAAAIPGVSAKISGLRDLVLELQGGIEAHLQMSLAAPLNVAAYSSSALVGVFNPEVLGALLDPTTWATASSGASVEIAARLGLVWGQLDLVTALVADLELGVNAGGVAAWSYTGAAQRMGVELGRAIDTQSCGVPPESHVSGLVIACESSDAWLSLGTGLRVGDAYPGTAQLEGVFSGGEIVTGLTAPLFELRAYVLSLQGLALALDAQLRLSFGVGIPPIGDLLSASASIDIGAALDGLLNIDVNIAAQVGLVLGQIEMLLGLVASLRLMLSGGGLVVWRYNGALRDLGGELASAVVDGVPGGHGPRARISGLAWTCAAPEVWANFGKIVAI